MKKLILILFIFINNLCFSESISKSQYGHLTISQLLILEKIKTAFANEIENGKEIIDYCFNIRSDSYFSEVLIRYFEINAKNVEKKQIKSTKINDLLSYHFDDDLDAMVYVIIGEAYRVARDCDPTTRHQRFKDFKDFIDFILSNLILIG